jgi:hypothetical protein
MPVHESCFDAAKRQLQQAFPDADVNWSYFPDHDKKESQFVFALDFGQTDCVIETVTVTRKETARAKNDHELTKLIACKVEDVVKKLMNKTGRFRV